VYAADGNAYFNRPGPRLADSAEILAAIFEDGGGGRGSFWLSAEAACASS
jgi:iron complex transport system substrate-binding protein